MSHRCMWKLEADFYVQLDVSKDSKERHGRSAKKFNHNMSFVLLCEIETHFIQTDENLNINERKATNSI